MCLLEIKMPVQPEREISPIRSRQPQPAEEHCPLCGQSLPHDLTLEDLQEQLREHERQAALAHESRIRAKLEKKGAEREQTIRAEAKTLAEAELKANTAKTIAERESALKEKDAANQQLAALEEQQKERTDKAIKNALSEQREALDTERVEAINKAKATEFDKFQKVQSRVEALQRQLEQKTTEELGEGAEVDLYEALRENFDGDKIKRIKKGQPGADILHEIIHNGQVCGSIVYDSKNHGSWRNSFVEKLKKDQLAAKAEHAILATSSFPSGSRQLRVQDGVIILNPARAVELVRIVRQHIVQTHRLRLSAEERDEKAQALYEFIASDRCCQLMDRYEKIAKDLLDIDVKEKTAHDRVWNTRGRLLMDIQKVHGDFRAEVDRIVEDGTLA